MATITVHIDESLLKAGQERAQSEGKSFDALLEELLAEKLSGPPGSSWADAFLTLARQTRGHSAQWKWNREDLHER